GTSYEDIATAHGLIHMGHNCNYLPLDPSIKEAMIRTIEAEEYRNYAPPYGFQELRDAIRADVGVPGVDVLVTHGSTDAIYQA
ncbi:MAG: aspartate aminotransferase, partial [Gammaproteobacteria bacterium]|nr:aspartate aminotransferase [Gammaproteobacteria bacterium]NIR83906.1 aspartate aminotransferase [Gammaproteobacteria bacterium]NIU05271.1 aspartate aminotransferase [Gammaproteobacteria bacterium]NIX86544.1 aspartate aminotransferase [Gammaproteobacteria bacterium]